MLLFLVISFIVLLFMGVPLALSVGFSSLVSLLLFSDMPSVMVVLRMYNQLDSFTLMAIPLFILTGQLMNTGGITRRIIKLADVFVGHIRGGLSHVNVLASMLFAGISGSATADAAGIGSILIPAMQEDGYEDDWAVGITAASSTIGPIIPPSILMIVYAAMTQLSVGKLFLAGLIPGILIGVSLLAAGYILAVKRNYKRKRKMSTLKEIGSALKEGWPPLMAPVIIIGGITGGVFTATEAGVVAAIYSLVLGLIYKELKFESLLDVFAKAVKSTAVVMFIFACAGTFGAILAIEQVPIKLAGFLTGLSLPPHIILDLVIVLMLIIGLLLDATSALIIFVPMLFPIGTVFGFGTYHFATIVVVSLLIGGITPPVGVLLYISCSVSNVPVKKVTRLVWFFVLFMVAMVFLIAYVPALVNFLPDRFIQ